MADDGSLSQDADNRAHPRHRHPEVRVTGLLYRNGRLDGVYRTLVVQLPARGRCRGVEALLASQASLRHRSMCLLSYRMLDPVQGHSGELPQWCLALVVLQPWPEGAVQLKII